jgi:hypothetical protein
MEQVKVVIRFADGKIVKGYTNDFFPKKPAFHVGSGPSDKGIQVSVQDLKAVFFVRDFEGNPGYDESMAFPEGRSVQGRKVQVTFKDGETLTGAVLGYDPNRPGFFMIPPDERSNNLRIFVVSAAVNKFDFL